MSRLLATLLCLCSTPAVADGLVLHEWGTFTAIAGADGRAELWQPLAGPSDLPDFVYDRTEQPDGVREVEVSRQDKRGYYRVRMETPVVYFYTDEPLDVSLSVGFRDGQITEWFPRVSSADAGGVDWGTFRVDPTLPRDFPTDGTDSHYYPAREVASAPVRVCDQRGDQTEAFLFYRGVGDFELDTRAVLTDGGVRLSDAGGRSFEAIVFDHRDGGVGVTAAHIEAGGVVVARPELRHGPEAGMQALREVLRTTGLYPDEVEAMLATWQDDWFEPGLRVFTILPREEVDAMLPMQVQPEPTESVRVIVGRVEVLTPDDLADARGLLQLDDAGSALDARFGRLAEPVLRRLAATRPELAADIAALLPADAPPAYSSRRSTQPADASGNASQ